MLSLGFTLRLVWGWGSAAIKASSNYMSFLFLVFVLKPRRQLRGSPIFSLKDKVPLIWPSQPVCNSFLQYYVRFCIGKSCVLIPGLKSAVKRRKTWFLLADAARFILRTKTLHHINNASFVLALFVSAPFVLWPLLFWPLLFGPFCFDPFVLASITPIQIYLRNESFPLPPHLV